MANRHLTPSSNHHKTSLSNRPTNLNSRRKISTVPEMSPEARRATLLAREDSKVNNKNNSRKKTDASCRTQDFHNDTDDSSDFVDPNNNSLRRKQQQDSKRTPNINSKPPQMSSRNTSVMNAKISSSSSTSRPPRAPITNTARSRSTISQNEPPFSMSDNEISSHLGTNTTSNASVYTSNLSTGNNNFNSGINGNIRNPNNNNLTDVNPADDDDNDSALPNDDSFDDEEEDTTFNKNSFVLALDKALEKSYVSRLKGDITDSTQVSKPGTVRALNGGRLTNAQEVVVNVCHNDDTELVFHDDDDESIDTAKAISEIRVNIWMEYNSRFPPDNSLHDFESSNLTDDAVVENENRKRKDSSSEISRQVRQPSASVNSKYREKSAIVTDRAGRKMALSSVSRGSVKGNNSNTTASGQSITDKPKPTNSNSLRLLSIPPSPTASRKSSATSSRGKVNSANSSNTKPSTPLRGRR